MANVVFRPQKGFRRYWETHQDLTQQEMAEEWGVAQPTISRWIKWIRIQEEEENRIWQEKDREYSSNFHELSEDDLPALLWDFLRFRESYFKTPRGTPYLTPGFQQKWIKAFLRALVTGDRLVILSPPRHGKTELLIHFCTWLIVRFPMIRILWVGGNESIARRSVREVAAHLTTNTQLVEDILGPKGSFRPDRTSGLPWSQTEFTVSTRPHPIKGASMTGLGRGGTLLSLDADLIVADDIEDHSSTIQPGGREGTRSWWTSQLESRKEEHTALCLIGSRQHPDDLAGHLLNNEAYTAIVETAHDLACTLPDQPYKDHVECLLFPELRSYKWLMEQRRAADTTGGRHIFEMVYLNISHPEGAVVFTPEVVNKGLDHTRAIGHIPLGAQLIAGLDPSGVGYQAAFLWALTIEPFKLYMVDLENNEGGGIKEARRVIAEWYEQYRVAYWVVEETMWAAGVSQDHELVDWASQRGITIEGHQTYTNKWDEHIGLSSLVPMFLEDEISLPYMDTPSRQKTDMYRNQLIHFTNVKRMGNRSKGLKSDLVMASWFPMDAIRRARSQQIAEMGVDYSPGYSSFGESEWNTAPWSIVDEELV